MLNPNPVYIFTFLRHRQLNQGKNLLFAEESFSGKLLRCQFISLHPNFISARVPSGAPESLAFQGLDPTQKSHHLDQRHSLLMLKSLNFFQESCFGNC